ncbi:MAG: hypothetical protein AB7U75_02790 [Hyphomicrobiaceae bacterium]
MEGLVSIIASRLISWCMGVATACACGVRMHSGMTLMTMDQPARAETRSERGFVVMTTEPA